MRTKLQMRGGIGWLLTLAALIGVPGLLLLLTSILALHHALWLGMKPSSSEFASVLAYTLFTLAALLWAAFTARLIWAAHTVISRRQAVLARLEPALSALSLTGVSYPRVRRPIRFCEMDADLPQAFTYGSMHPTIVISRGLRGRLSHKGFAAILAHEIHHTQVHDYLIQQIFLSIIKAFPWLGIKKLYTHYLTQREVRADQFAATWQQTPHHLIEAIAVTLRALGTASARDFPSETGWNSVWQARIAALSPESEPPSVTPLFLRLPWGAVIVPGASSALFAAASLSMFCH